MPERIRAGNDVVPTSDGAPIDAGMPDLFRVAHELATGAGKTTVMAMLIAWGALNAARWRKSKTFSQDFPLVAPGKTIRDRLRVLQPNDPNEHYRQLDQLPPTFLG